ncbi:MAG: energy-coupled thiamine transporter ThiT [Clostridia bacterium]|nr:energy-coupled thiamine transporter ThiT [Clostridia bacterium]
MTNKKQIRNLTLSAIFVALSTALSMLKVYHLPLGGSVTLFSMLPIIMISEMLGLKWGVGSAFCYSLVQLGHGIAVDGVFSWGLTSTALIGTILLDYILPFTVLGLARVTGNKNTVHIVMGTALVLVIRFLCHLLSGAIIFDIWCEWEDVWFYSLCYNGSYMLPELVITVVGAAIVFNLPQVKKIVK